MASDPDRDKDTNSSSSPKSDNPFIRFRQFADEQISSLLRGVIGLPSTFERGQNAKWADFDEDLRRRDELQARQQQLRESEARRALRRTAEEHTEHINKSWPVQTGKENLPPQMDEKAARDLPLFSPVYKSLFNHLDKRGDNAPDWNAAISINSLKKGLIPIYYPYALRREQQSPDLMRNVQYFVYNELNAGPFMRSEYSLLPYILFSPYSPLKLSANRSYISPDHNESKVDEFPYCQAFEDLLLETVHGKEATKFPLSPHYIHDPVYLRSYPCVGMEWIQDLHDGGLLQQKERKSVRDLICWPAPSSAPRLEIARKTPGDGKVSAETEQELYDFLSAAARTPESLGSIFGDAEAFILKQLKTLESPEGKQALRELLDSKMAKEIFEMVKEAERMAKMSASETKPRQKIYTTSSDVERIAETLPAEAKSNDPKPTTSPQETNRVVATSTTSERNVDEDGSVETTVTVWKRFADGRESTTTTTHFEDSGAWKDSEEERQEVKSEKKPEQSKKGWFWN